MRLLTAALLFTAVASAQEMPTNPLMTVSKTLYGISRSDIMRSVDKIPEGLWSFQPTKDVRTVAQLFAHIADATGSLTPAQHIDTMILTRLEFVPPDGVLCFGRSRLATCESLIIRHYWTCR